MSLIFSKVLSFFLIIGVGFAAGRKGILSASAGPVLVSLLLYITSPCMILTSIAGREQTEETLLLSVDTFFCAAIYFLVLTFAGYVLFGRILKFRPCDDIPVSSMFLLTCGSILQ